MPSIGPADLLAAAGATMDETKRIGGGYRHAEAERRTSPAERARALDRPADA